MEGGPRIHLIAGGGYGSGDLLGKRFGRGGDAGVDDELDFLDAPLRRQRKFRRREAADEVGHSV